MPSDSSNGEDSPDQDRPEPTQPSAHRPSVRLLKAIAAGEVTVGGLAEAGWFYLGMLDGAPMYITDTHH